MARSGQARRRRRPPDIVQTEASRAPRSEVFSARRLARWHLFPSLRWSGALASRWPSTWAGARGRTGASAAEQLAGPGTCSRSTLQITITSLAPHRPASCSEAECSGKGRARCTCRTTVSAGSHHELTSACCGWQVSRQVPKMAPNGLRPLRKISGFFCLQRTPQASIQ